MNECVFCRIVARQAKGDIVFQDEQVTAFHDSHPVAPTHILLVPNRHIQSVNDLEPQDEGLVGHMVIVASRLAKQEGIHQSGYRLIINSGRDANQRVFHLHVHLMGGQPMRYPIG